MTSEDPTGGVTPLGIRNTTWDEPEQGPLGDIPGKSRCAKPGKSSIGTTSEVRLDRYVPGSRLSRIDR